MTQEHASKLPDPLQPIRYQVADALGSLMELWGFKRIMGRTWALLYLSAAPLTAAELGDALHVSPGSVSMTMSELLKWGVVKKTWVPGDRRDFYQPETSVWKMVSRVIRERELLHVRETNDRLAAAQQCLTAGAPGSAAADADAARDADAAVLLARITALQQLGQVGQQLLEQVLDGRTIDVVALQTALNLMGTPLGGRVDEQTPPPRSPAGDPEE